ncbi:helix-turn-helix transcriptional regulator [Pedobacter aquatilis]|uniref:helix-turn-helix domain-containing protein n=1 Tax=Pedobacter aquatilis TaxID=351343 RepID=UPI0025B36D3B|nr:helix-turn-helix transcriptional regulator [Pedobacter aquatilis]MDN3588726.1 helix-turn-helix transcriptional regulator [Pedobacter aquatilis]
MKSIGENIKKCRVESGLSQADVARLLKISTPAFCKIETGQTDLNISRLLQISKLFKVPASELITGETYDSESIVDLSDLKQQLVDKDEELNKLRKKVIELYDKLGM